MEKTDRNGGPAPKDASLAEAELEAAFAVLRMAAPQPSAALTERLLADAFDQQPRPVPPVPQPDRAGRSSGGFWARGLAAVGGWGAVGGLTTAGLIGVWIGFSPPQGLAGLTGLADGVLGSTAADEATTVELLEFLPSFDDYLTEG